MFSLYKFCVKMLIKLSSPFFPPNLSEFTLRFFLSSKTISTLSTLEVELQFETLGQFNKSTNQNNNSRKGLQLLQLEQ